MSDLRTAERRDGEVAAFQQMPAALSTSHRHTHCTPGGGHTAACVAHRAFTTPAATLAEALGGLHVQVDAGYFPCPTCQARDAQITLDGIGWRCFACRRTGSVLQLAIAVASDPVALRRLAELDDVAGAA